MTWNFFFTTILWIVGFPVKKEKKKKVQPRRQTAGQQNFFLPQKKVQIINNNNRRSILPIYLPLPAFKKRNVAIYRAARSEVVSYRNFRSTSKFPVGRDTRMTCGSVRCLSSALAGNFCEGSVMMMVFFRSIGKEFANGNRLEGTVFFEESGTCVFFCFISALHACIL